MQVSVRSHKDLTVWQKALDLVVLVYTLTDTFPTRETYGLASQMRRAAVSIPSNIAEGYRRGTRRDYRSFVTIAYGSGAELETHFEIAVRAKLVDASRVTEAIAVLGEVMRMLNKLRRSLGEHTSVPSTQCVTHAFHNPVDPAERSSSVPTPYPQLPPP